VYVLVSSMVLLNRLRKFHNRFILGGAVNHTPNTQPGGPGTTLRLAPTLWPVWNELRYQEPTGPNVWEAKLCLSQARTKKGVIEEILYIGPYFLHVEISTASEWVHLLKLSGSHMYHLLWRVKSYAFCPQSVSVCSIWFSQ
jgi:hypothetical protein